MAARTSENRPQIGAAAPQNPSPDVSGPELMRLEGLTVGGGSSA